MGRWTEPPRQRLLARLLGRLAFSVPVDAEELRHEVVDERLLVRGQVSGHRLCYPLLNRPPYDRNTFRTRVWVPALEKSKLGFHVRMHDLRHANASWLLAGGADLKAVMDRLGHSQIQTTQRYLHSLPDADEKALAACKWIQHNEDG